MLTREYEDRIDSFEFTGIVAAKRGSTVINTHRGLGDLGPSRTTHHNAAHSYLACVVSGIRMRSTRRRPRVSVPEVRTDYSQVYRRCQHRDELPPRAHLKWTTCSIHPPCKWSGIAPERCSHSLPRRAASLDGELEGNSITIASQNVVTSASPSGVTLAISNGLCAGLVPSAENVNSVRTAQSVQNRRSGG